MVKRPCITGTGIVLLFVLGVLLTATGDPAAAPLFHAVIHYEAGDGPDDVAAGDFDKDGHLDVVVTNTGALSYGFKILFGTGNGGFSTPVHYGGNSYNSVIAEDFDGDGDPDLAVLGYAPQLSIYEYLGDGTFNDLGSQIVGTCPCGMTTGDFNEDGDTDIAVANKFFHDVAILYGFPGCGFMLSGAVPAANEPQSITAGYFDGDTHVDLAVAATGDAARWSGRRSPGGGGRHVHHGHKLRRGGGTRVCYCRSLQS